MPFKPYTVCAAYDCPGLLCFPPMHFHPLHHWLRSWSALGSVHGPSGVSIPGEEEVVREACCLNVWASQWPADLQRAAAEWATAGRGGRACRPTSDCTAWRAELRGTWLRSSGPSGGSDRWQARSQRSTTWLPVRTAVTKDTGWLGECERERERG